MQQQKHPNWVPGSKKKKRSTEKLVENNGKKLKHLKINLVETNAHNHFTNRSSVTINWDVAYLLFHYIAL